MLRRSLSRSLCVRVACVVALAALPRTVSAAAAPGSGNFQITGYAGQAFFRDPIVVHTPYDVRANDAPHFGGSIGYQFNPLFGLQFGAGTTSTTQDTLNGGDIDYSRMSGDMLISPLRGNSWDLYGLIGGGYGRFNALGSRRNFGSFDVGAGLRWWFADHFGARVEARNTLAVKGGHPQDSNQSYDIVSAGLTWAIGGSTKDTDGDGVTDGKDKCPNTPTGATVDAKGCPTDSDADGVFDGIDTCPGTLKGAKVDAKGCALDADADGIPDGIDTCANTPAGATVNAQGCPSDSDGDGVPDGIDKCANTPAGTPVDATGCVTDADGDGVPDNLDKCPNTPAGTQVDASGCTQMQTEFRETGVLRLQNVSFATGKAELLPESYAILDQVGQALSGRPELKIEIGGHTDSQGAASANQKLSDRRAKAVRAYLVSKFPNLDTPNLTTKGYGESKPVAKNDTKANMAKNRRVEFVVLNKEALQK